MKPEIEKIIELLQQIEPEASKEELEAKAQNIWEIALFLVQLKLREHSKQPKPMDLRTLPENRGNSP